MRLIDADAMIEDLKNQMKTATNPFFAMFCDNCIAHLEKRPTAYDVEALRDKPAETITYGIKVTRCKECDRGNLSWIVSRIGREIEETQRDAFDGGAAYRAGLYKALEIIEEGAHR